MAEYTAFVEAGNALVELLRDNLVPEPLGSREAISLCSPHESENNQLTVFLYHIEEENKNQTAGFYSRDRDTEQAFPGQYALRFLLTAHSKAPAPLKEADQYRVMGAVMQTLRDNPVIKPKYLSGSAAEEGADWHVMVEKTPLDQLLKIWNNNTRDYKLSVSVLMTGITIRSTRKRRVTRVREFEVDTGRLDGQGTFLNESDA